MDRLDEMFAAARGVQQNAYAPYSNYLVGAAILTDHGNIYAGCNVENAAYPQGACAEAAAIAAMVGAGERVIVAVLTVTDGDNLGTCCGGCRQRIREFAALDTPIYAADGTGVRARFTLDELLPHSFGPEHLDARGRQIYDRDMSDRLPYLSSRLQGLGTTIFGEMSALAVATGSVNLGQGFPDTDGPREVLDAAIDAINSGQNQYPPLVGVPVLRQAIVEHQQRFYGMPFDVDTEVLVTAGASEALASVLIGLLDTGDEVVTFEPTYDMYQACAAMSGATIRPITLRPPEYAADLDEMRAAITPRTKLILLNTPHNPTGKVFTREELLGIASIAIEHDLVVVTDEVYEHLTFDNLEHIPIASLPGIRDRTLTISSGGKTFNTTGWKVGWIVGPAALVTAARTAKQYLTYVNSGPFQPAIAVGLRLADQFFTDIALDLQGKRDRLCAGLVEAGFDVFHPQGTYFVTVDIRPLRGDGDGYAFCRELPHRCGVVAVPNEVFFTDPRRGRHLVRFAFSKRLDVLDEAAARLKGLSR